MNGRAIAIGLGVLCAILVIALAYTVFNYNGMLQDKNSQISSLESQINDLQNQVDTLNTQVSNLQNQLNNMTGNQVQVSGTVQITQTGTLYFIETPWHEVENNTVSTSAPIVEGGYSVLLVGGKSYDIFVNDYPFYLSDTPDYTLYVPEGVTTFTANF